MARNLLKAGHDLKAYDLAPALLARIVAAGALAAASPADAAKDVDIVVTMLPASQHVRAVYLGEGRLIQHAKPGTLLIDSSTIDVATAREVAAAAAAAGLPMIDTDRM